MSSAGRIINRPVMTATKDAALARKTHAVPTPSIMSPATAGPKMRAALNVALLSPTAFGSSALPTSSETKAWRVGLSTAVAMPSRKAKT